MKRTFAVYLITCLATIAAYLALQLQAVILHVPPYQIGQSWSVIVLLSGALALFVGIVKGRFNPASQPVSDTIAWVGGIICATTIFCFFLQWMGMDRIMEWADALFAIAVVLSGAYFLVARDGKKWGN